MNECKIECGIHSDALKHPHELGMELSEFVSKITTWRWCISLRLLCLSTLMHPNFMGC